MSVKIQLDALDLFGNDAAEDEEEDIFQSYALEREETRIFTDPLRRLCVVRAYKGEGKSALLRLAASRVGWSDSKMMLIRESATSLAASVTDQDFARCVREWKRAILGRIANEIGNRIDFAWSDDAMSLVEEAERQGFKARSVLASILERIGVKAKASVGGWQVETSLARLGTPDPAATVQRWLDGKEPLWVFLDDVDLNFQNTAANKTKVAAFFVACREMVNQVPQLRLRAAVRPNVWTIIKMEFEALSHVEQYITDLTWSEDAQRRLLARRIEGYLQRRAVWDELAVDLPSAQWDRDKAIIALAFRDPMPWGKSTRPPHVLLHTLSKKRPRWLVELCKMSGQGAARRDADVIDRADIFKELTAFGKRRIQDTIAEFRSQCPEVEELLAAFMRGNEEYSTAELLSLIEKKILSHLKPKIFGVIGAAGAMDVAAFLFEIGFFFGRREREDGHYDHITFSDRPSLLRSRTSIDDGLRWEIHPAFRTALEMRDPSGYETASLEEKLKSGVTVRRKN